MQRTDTVEYVYQHVKQHCPRWLMLVIAESFNKYFCIYEYSLNITSPSRRIPTSF